MPGLEPHSRGCGKRMVAVVPTLTKSRQGHPPHVTARIPRGKGMAGLALERGTAVSTCDLQSDETGDVRPGAKAVDAAAAVAIPVTHPSGAIAAVVGIAYKQARPITKELLSDLTLAASTLALRR